MKKNRSEEAAPEQAELAIALQAAHQQILVLENRLDEFKWLEDSLRRRTKELS